MKKNDADNPLQCLKEEIRAEAQRLRARAGHGTPVAAAPRPIGELTSMRNEFTIDELAGFQFIEFIEHAYSALLRRTPDSVGFAAQLRLLEEGRSKVEILGNLRFSEEGRAVGVRVPWLLPRYLLAKATRIPVIGYAIEWLMCVCELPFILRHQRAVDNYRAAREQADRKESAGIADQLHLLREQASRLENQRADVVAQFATLHVEIGKSLQEIGDLRHLVLSMDHWLASLRQNLAALESAEAEHLRKADALHAGVTEKLLQVNTERAGRLQQLAGNFVQGLPPSAEVLDIGGGLDWLRAMLHLGVNITTVNPSPGIGQRIREADVTVAIAEPSVVLARMADQSLDAVVILDLASLLRSMPAAILLDIVRRVLRPAGQILIGTSAESATIADRLDGRASVQVDGDLVERALQVSGFVEARRIAASGSSDFLIASQPHQ